VCFLLLFSVFNTAQSLAAKVLSDLGFGNLGFYSLAVLYFSFALSCLVASAIVNKMGERFSLAVGSQCYTLYISSFALAAASAEKPDSNSWFLNSTFISSAILIAAAANGFGAAILWTAQGRYVSRIASESNKGTFFGVFWVFLMLNFIVGVLGGAFALKNVNPFSFYLGMTLLSFVSCLFFLCLRPVQPNEED